MRRVMAMLIAVSLGWTALGCGGPAAQIPEDTVKFDSTRDKVELGGIGGSGGGMPRKGGTPTGTSKAPG